MPISDLYTMHIWMGVQDDRREFEQLELFELDQPNDRTRSGTDATLTVSDQIVEFELKSTTKESVTTVRDFGMDHILKWQDKHWLFGFYTAGGKALRFTRYASPKMMAGWIDEKRRYIETDFKLADFAPAKLDISDLHALVGAKQRYKLSDAKFLHKKQLSSAEYIELQDVPSGYSPERMLEILKMRCRYVIHRGSTLNNPHIPKHVLETFPKITEDHAKRLRQLVQLSLNN